MGENVIKKMDKNSSSDSFSDDSVKVIFLFSFTSLAFLGSVISKLQSHAILSQNLHFTL